MQCNRCPNEIPVERLKILPETKLCVDCSRAVGGEFQMVPVLVNHSKVGSLKRNYGSIDVVRVRRQLPPVK